VANVGDGISMNHTSHVWLDHLRFNLISDGHIDMYDSDNVTQSWNRFKGENEAVCGGKHHYTQLISEPQVTLHHNDWTRRSSLTGPCCLTKFSDQTGAKGIR
jgi:pectate lyase